MNNNEHLTAWVELLDCSILMDTKSISELLCSIGEDDVGLENSGVVVNEDDTTIVSHEMHYYESAPPDFAKIFQKVVPYLQIGESIVYAAKFGFGFQEHPLVMYVITDKGVFDCNSSVMLSGLSRFIPRESDDHSDKVKEDLEL